MRIINTAILFVSLLATSCSGNHSGKADKTMEEHDSIAEGISDIPYTFFNPADTAEMKKTYMHTGFYSLTDNEGVKMRKEKSNEVYNLNRLPFVSTDNITDTRLEERPSGSSMPASLVITFDKEGAHALQEGTGNPAYPYLAMVVANRLLYVVKNASKIKGDVVNISLDGFSQMQIDSMMKDVQQEK